MSLVVGAKWRTLVECRVWRLISSRDVVLASIAKPPIGEKYMVAKPGVSPFVATFDTLIEAKRWTEIMIVTGAL